MTGDINGYLVKNWKRERQREVKPIRVHNNVKILLVFITWRESAELVEYGTYDKIQVPAVPNDGDVSNEGL